MSDVPDYQAQTTQVDHAYRHESGGADEIDLTGLSGAGGYVDRGDPSSPDYTSATLTLDNNWHDLDLSGIIPAGGKAALFRIIARTASVGSSIQFKMKGKTQSSTVATVYINVSNGWEWTEKIVPVDANRFIEYKISNVSWSALTLTVAGWWK